VIASSSDVIRPFGAVRVPCSLTSFCFHAQLTLCFGPKLGIIALGSATQFPKLPGARFDFFVGRLVRHVGLLAATQLQFVSAARACGRARTLGSGHGCECARVAPIRDDASLEPRLPAGFSLPDLTDGEPRASLTACIETPMF
jgi:hypothetical protein